MTTARPAQLVFGVFLNSWLACSGKLLVGADRWHAVSFLWVFLTQLSQAAILVGSVITPRAAGKYHLTALQMEGLKFREAQPLAHLCQDLVPGLMVCKARSAQR